MCHGTDDGRELVQCDACSTWYHLECIGIEDTSAGAIVGWTTHGDGDNFVDFGLYANTPEKKRFLEGNENGILLDFNVDGVMYDKI